MLVPPFSSPALCHASASSGEAAANPTVLPFPQEAGCPSIGLVMAKTPCWVIQKTIGFRVKNEDEIAGIDTVVHGEEGYKLETV